MHRRETRDRGRDSKSHTATERQQSQHSQSISAAKSYASVVGSQTRAADTTHHPVAASAHTAAPQTHALQHTISQQATELAVLKAQITALTQSATESTNAAAPQINALQQLISTQATEMALLQAQITALTQSQAVAVWSEIEPVREDFRRLRAKIGVLEFIDRRRTEAESKSDSKQAQSAITAAERKEFATNIAKLQRQIKTLHKTCRILTHTVLLAEIAAPEQFNELVLFEKADFGAPKSALSFRDIIDPDHLQSYPTSDDHINLPKLLDLVSDMALKLAIPDSDDETDTEAEEEITESSSTATTTARYGKPRANLTATTTAQPTQTEQTEAKTTAQATAQQVTQLPGSLSSLVFGTPSSCGSSLPSHTHSTIDEVSKPAQATPQTAQAPLQTATTPQTAQTTAKPHSVQITAPDQTTPAHSTPAQPTSLPSPAPATATSRACLLASFTPSVSVVVHESKSMPISPFTALKDSTDRANRDPRSVTKPLQKQPQGTLTCTEQKEREIKTQTKPSAVNIQTVGKRVSTRNNRKRKGVRTVVVV